MADAGELQKLAPPDLAVRQRLWVKHTRQLTILTKLHTDATHDCLRTVTKHSRLDATENHMIPTVACPSLFVLIAPVSLLTPIKTGISHQYRRHLFTGKQLAPKVLRFLRIKIINPVTINFRLPIRIRCLIKRLLCDFKQRRTVGVYECMFEYRFYFRQRDSLGRSQFRYKTNQIKELLIGGRC